MTWIYRDILFQQHLTGEHPERVARLVAIEEKLTREGWLAKCGVGVSREATAVEMERCHDPAYLESLMRACAKGGGRIEADTVVSEQSYAAARRAAGTAAGAVDDVLTGKTKQALCLLRPPGHHALCDRAMGFCLLNNVAIAAEQAIAQHGLKRVLIVDWDVHHGNGTQEAFYARDDVTFFSSHRSPFYPGTGKLEETGTGRGLGYNFNLPVAFGISRAEFLKQFEAMLQKSAEKCRPELVLISAGFDAHRLDPIGSLGLETEDFARLTELVRDVAKVYAGGRLVSLLEGGYHLEALADSVAVHLKTLLG